MSIWATAGVVWVGVVMTILAFVNGAGLKDEQPEGEVVIDG